MGRRRLAIPVLATAALITAPLFPAAAAAAEPPELPDDQELVLFDDFSGDALADGLVASGGTADTLVIADGVLTVQDRDADYVGIETAPLEAGTTYTVSVQVRLADGTPATQARFVGVPGYTWIGNTDITADDWTTVTGTWTAPDTDETVKLYLGTGDIAGLDSYTYLIDDLLITRTATGAEPPAGDDVVPGGATDPVATPVTLADGTGNVSALTFDDGPNGETTAALLDYLGANGIQAVFCVIGQNIQAPGGAELLRRMVDEGHVLCNHTTSYADLGSASPDAIRADLVENLRIIREALGDPEAAVPYFRAPNGSWGATPDVAVSLGMQPLAVVNTINDWAETDPAVLTENLRTAMRPGEIVLVHDGGGDREPSLQAVRTVVDERLAAGWTFTLPAGAPAQLPPGEVLIDEDFESGTPGAWFPRAGSDASDPTVAVVTGGADGTGHAAEVANRTHEGDGIQADVTGILLPGQTYQVSAAVRFAEGADPGQGLSLSIRTVQAGSITYTNLVQIETATASEFTTVTGEFTVPAYDEAAELYFEARYNSGNTATFLVDEIRVSVPEPNQVDTSLVPIRDTVDFPVGVAIDSRETTGAASELLLHHFDQITPENHMKVEAWYDEDHAFRRHAEATALLDYAQANDLRLYGHVLLWHSQTPDWFFQDETGRELTDSPADQQFLRDRLAKHIDDVARSIYDDYGPYGSAGNPIVAWDVVNEVIADQTTPDGLRTSRWHDILGEEYVHLAFELAEEAFNGTYAADGVDRPVKLFINDYNTEQDRKGAQYEALVHRMLQAGTPFDGVGHQFHLSVDTSLSSLEAALDRFSGLGLMQEVTELDITINPPSEANLVRQAHFYRDLFALLRQYHADAPADEKLFSATVWGLTDTRSWRAEQAPLLFTGDLQAKPAYFGAIDDAEGVPPLLTTANVFQGDVAIDDGFADAVEWRNLPENPLTGDAGGFQLRWNDDHLTVLVRTTDAPELIEFTYGDEEFTYRPSTGGFGTLAVTAPGATVEVDGEHFTVVHLPHTGAAIGDSAAFDVRVVSGGEVVGAWNSPGATGTLTLLEPLSYLEIPELAAPAVDGTVDDVWQDAAVVTTATTVEGSSEGARADVRALWQGDRLYVLYEVTDAVIDETNSDPWNRDSVELFLDLGNTKSGAYGPNDTQIRVTLAGELSFGTGDAALQQSRVAEHATALTGSGYVVELAIALTGQSGGQSDVPLGGADTFHGFDAQVNDGRDGARFAVHTWAEPTGTGYQNTARWGVIRLVPADAGTDDPSGPSDPDGGTPGDGAPGDGAPGDGADGGGAAAPGGGDGLASTGATVPWGITLLAGALLALGTLLGLRGRRRMS